MTIKEFAHLCGCNPQTLRYYDRVGLLKPVKVDSWSGYRYYDEQQALRFVKIRNLQAAGFSIEEIKNLLDADNNVIYDAISGKIKDLEERLRKTERIRDSYQTEMNQMKQKLENMREYITSLMKNYDPTEEFGIDRNTYDQMISNIHSFFENMISSNDDSDFEFSEYSEGDDSQEEEEYLDFLNDPEYEIVYQKHGWHYVKEFYQEFSKLEDGVEYALLFKVIPEKSSNTAFANTILGMLLLSNPGTKRKLGCNVTESPDDQNHFWLLKRK